MAYKLKRMGKKAYKFEYSLVLHSLTIEVKQPKFSPNQVSIAFSRRGKRMYSKLVKWEPSINNPSHGHVVWPEPEKMTTVVTLYKGQKDHVYENKEWEVSIVEVNRDGNKKCLAKKAINMADFIGDVLGYSQDLKLRLTPSGRKMKLSSLDCTLNSRFVRAGMPTDSDMHSVTSQMSVSALSSISDTDDLDVADLTDLDDTNDTFGESFEPELVKPSLYAPPSYVKHEDLLTWTQKCADKYHGVTIRNFTTSWRNGLAFAAIIHYHRPDLLDFESLDPLDVTRNNKKAFEAAHTLGVPRMIKPEQMDQWLVPDRLMVTSFVYQLFIRLEAPENIPTGVDSAHLPKRSQTYSGDLSPSPVSNDDKPKRLLPSTPKQTSELSSETQKRVREFLSDLDHTSPTHNKEIFADYQQDRKRKVGELNTVPKGCKQNSPFFGRKAGRKMRSAERARQEQPFIPHEVGKNALEVSVSINIDIDSEFDSKDLFENSLLNKAERELTPKLIKKRSEKQLGSLGKAKPQHSLLDIVTDPAILQEAKLLTKRKSKKTILTRTSNPLYTTQEPQGFSSSDTSVSESGTPRAANNVIPTHKLRDNSQKRDCSVNRDKKTKELVSTQRRGSQQGDSCCKTAVKKLAHIKSRREIRLKKAPVKEYEQEHTLLLKKYASVPHMEEMNSEDQILENSDETRSDADSPKNAHWPLQFQRSISYSQGEFQSDNSDGSEQCSAYSHLLSTQISANDELTNSDTHSHRLLDCYNTRIAPKLVQSRQHAACPKNGEKRVILSAYEAKDDKKTFGSVENVEERRSEYLPEVIPRSNSIFSEETDYIAHMQKKLCSMQISIETRQTELKEQIIEAASSNDNDLERELMDKLIQLVQQKAQLDNRYDDLMAVTEEKNPANKEEMLRKELKHKRRIDRSIKSKEQLWEEEILEKEIKEIVRERREHQSPHTSPSRREQFTNPEVVEVVPPSPTVVTTQTSNKGKELGWRERLLNVLA